MNAMDILVKLALHLVTGDMPMPVKSTVDTGTTNHRSILLETMVLMHLWL